MKKIIKIIMAFSLVLSLNLSVLAYDNAEILEEDIEETTQVIPEEVSDFDEKEEPSLENIDDETSDEDETDTGHSKTEEEKKTQKEEKKTSQDEEEKISQDKEGEKTSQDKDDLSSPEKEVESSFENKEVEVANGIEFVKAYNDEAITKIILTDNIELKGALKRRETSLHVDGDNKTINAQNLSTSLFPLDYEVSDTSRRLFVENLYVQHNGLPVIVTSSQTRGEKLAHSGSGSNWDVELKNFETKDKKASYIVKGEGINKIKISGRFDAQASGGAFHSFSDLLIEDANVQDYNGLIGSNIQIVNSEVHSHVPYGNFLSQKDIYIDKSTLILSTDSLSTFKTNDEQSSLILNESALDIQRAKEFASDFEQVYIQEDSKVIMSSFEKFLETGQLVISNSKVDVEGASVGVKANEMSMKGSEFLLKTQNQGLDVGALDLRSESSLSIKTEVSNRSFSGIQVGQRLNASDSKIQVTSKSNGIKVLSDDPLSFNNMNIDIDSELTGLVLNGSSEWSDSSLKIHAKETGFRSFAKSSSVFNGTDIKIISKGGIGFRNAAPFYWESSPMEIESYKQGLYSESQEALKFDSSQVEIKTYSKDPSLELNGESHWDQSNLSIQSDEGIGFKSNSEKLMSFKNANFKISSYSTAFDVSGPVKWLQTFIHLTTNNSVGVKMRNGFDIEIDGEKIHQENSRVAWETDGSITMNEVDVNMTTIENAFKASELKINDSEFQMNNVKNIFASESLYMKNTSLKAEGNLETFLQDLINLPVETFGDEDGVYTIIDSQLNLNTLSSQPLIKLGLQTSSAVKKLVIEGPKTKINIHSEGRFLTENALFSLKGQKIKEGQKGGMYIRDGALVKVKALYDPQIVYFQQAGSEFQVDGENTELEIIRQSQQNGISPLFNFYYVGNQSFIGSNHAKIKVVAEESLSPVFWMRGSDNVLKLKSGSQLDIETGGYEGGSTQNRYNQSQAIVFSFSHSSEQARTINKIDVSGEETSLRIFSKQGPAVYSPYDQVDINLENGASFIADGKTNNQRGLFEANRMNITLDKPGYYDFLNRSEDGGNIIQTYYEGTSYTSIDTHVAVWEKGQDFQESPSRIWSSLDFSLKGKTLREIEDTNQPDDFHDGSDSFGEDGLEAYTRISGKSDQNLFIIEAQEKFITLKDFSEKIKNNKDLMEQMQVKAYEQWETTTEKEAIVLDQDGLEYSNPLPGSYTIQFGIQGIDGVVKTEKIHIFNSDHLEENEEFIILADDFYDNKTAYLQNDQYFIDKANAKAYSKENLDDQLGVSLAPHNMTDKPKNYTLTFYISDKRDVKVEAIAKIMDRDHVVETEEFVIAANDIEFMEYEVLNITDDEIIEQSMAYGFKKNDPDNLLDVSVKDHDIKPVKGMYRAQLELNH